jgi:hypothetical protein
VQLLSLVQAFAPAPATLAQAEFLHSAWWGFKQSALAVQRLVPAPAILVQALLTHSLWVQLPMVLQVLAPAPLTMTQALFWHSRWVTQLAPTQPHSVSLAHWFVPAPATFLQALVVESHSEWWGFMQLAFAAQ